MRKPTDAEVFEFIDRLRAETRNWRIVPWGKNEFAAMRIPFSERVLTGAEIRVRAESERIEPYIFRSRESADDFVTFNAAKAAMKGIR
jgi:hypothetical protein